jgi:hypothetical protein
MVSGARMFLVGLVTMGVVVGCAPQEDAAEPANTAAPVAPAPEPAPSVPARPVPPADLDLLAAIDAFLDELGDVGGGTFVVFEAIDGLLNPLLSDVAIANGVSPYGPDGADFPTGIDLSASTDAERDLWRAEGERVLGIIERELATWRAIEPLLDASGYGHPELDELAARIDEYLRIDVDVLELLAGIADREGPEGLAGPEAMQAIAAWLYDERQNDLGFRLAVRVSNLSATIMEGEEEFRARIDRLNRAVPKIGMSVGE